MKKSSKEKKMVFNDFILSLQLDPAIFNPFDDRNDASRSDDNDEGDAYILDHDYASPPTEFKTSPDYEVKSSSDVDNSSDDRPEEDRGPNPCYQCIYCQQSSDPYDSSDSYICTRDNCYIKEKKTSTAVCYYFSKNEDIYEDY